MQISVAGMPWYREEDYARILSVMTDAANLPLTYQDWLKKAEQVERTFKAKGMTVIRAIIDPDAFPAWCAAIGLNVDASSRSRWGNEAAIRSVKGNN